MKSVQDQFRNKYSRKVFEAVFYKGQPEEIHLWPLLEVKRINGIIGSGESSQFGASAIARLDGKRIAYSRTSTYQPGIDVQGLDLPGTPVHIADIPGGKLYVIKPNEASK